MKKQEEVVFKYLANLCDEDSIYEETADNMSVTDQDTDHEEMANFSEDDSCIKKRDSKEGVKKFSMKAKTKNLIDPNGKQLYLNLKVQNNENKNFVNIENSNEKTF